MSMSRISVQCTGQQLGPGTDRLTAVQESTGVQVQIGGQLNRGKLASGS